MEESDINPEVQEKIEPLAENANEQSIDNTEVKKTESNPKDTLSQLSSLSKRIEHAKRQANVTDRQKSFANIFDIRHSFSCVEQK